jgi:hypothetical protein
LIRRTEGYCLSPQADGFLALSLGRGEAGGFRVNWLETLPAGRPGAAPHLRELTRASRRLLLLLPNDSCQLLHARLPEMRPELQRLALAGLLQKQRGGVAEQWSVDVRRRGGAKSSDGRSVVTGLALERVALQKLLQPLAGGDLHPGLGLPQALAMDAYLRRELQASDPGSGAWNLVFLGRDERFLVIGDAAGPLLVRALPADLSGGTDRAEYLERLGTEIERSHFFAQQGEQGTRVQRVLVCGDPELADPLAQRLAKTEGLRAEHWQPERSFRVEAAVASWESLPILAGAAVALEGSLFNIMPRRREDSAFWRLRRYALTGGATFCLGLLPLVGGGGEVTRRVQARVLEQQAQQLELSREAAEAAARAYVKQVGLLARQQQLDRYTPEETPLGPLLRDIAARLPGPVQLVDLDILREETGGYRVVLRGECRGRTGEQAQAAFLQFHAALAGTAFLAGGAEPVLLQIDGERDDEGSQSRVSFELRYRLAAEVKG